QRRRALPPARARGSAAGGRARTSAPGHRRGCDRAARARAGHPRDGLAAMRRGALPAIVLGAALLGAWEAYVDLSGVEADLLPAPHAVASALWSNGGLLWRNF